MFNDPEGPTTFDAFGEYWNSTSQEGRASILYDIDE